MKTLIRNHFRKSYNISRLIAAFIILFTIPEKVGAQLVINISNNNVEDLIKVVEAINNETEAIQVDVNFQGDFSYNLNSPLNINPQGSIREISLKTIDNSQISIKGTINISNTVTEFHILDGIHLEGNLNNNGSSLIFKNEREMICSSEISGTGILEKQGNNKLTLQSDVKITTVNIKSGDVIFLSPLTTDEINISAGNLTTQDIESKKINVEAGAGFFGTGYGLIENLVLSGKAEFATQPGVDQNIVEINTLDTYIDSRLTNSGVLIRLNLLTAKDEIFLENNGILEIMPKGEATVTKIQSTSGIIGNIKNGGTFSGSYIKASIDNLASSDFTAIDVEGGFINSGIATVDQLIGDLNNNFSATYKFGTIDGKAVNQGTLAISGTHSGYRITNLENSGILDLAGNNPEKAVYLNMTDFKANDNSFINIKLIDAYNSDRITIQDNIQYGRGKSIINLTNIVESGEYVIIQSQNSSIDTDKFELLYNGNPSSQSSLSSRNETELILTTTNPATPIDGYSIEPIDDRMYIGIPIEPAVKVIDPEGTELKQDADYSVDYNNNTSVGIAEITVKGIGNYSGTLKTQFNITPATLIVEAKAQNMLYGTDPSSLVFTDAYNISGFVNNETEIVLNDLPQVSIDQSITSTSPVGIYQEKVLVSGADAENYIFTYNNNTLTIIKNEEGGHLVFDPILRQQYGYAPFELTGHHKLGKPVVFESMSPDTVSVAQHGEKWLATIHNAGKVTIKIRFEGDNDVEKEELSQDIDIAKAPLIITAMDQSRGYLQKNPDVSSQYCISGYVKAGDENHFISHPVARINSEYDLSPPNTYDDGVNITGGEHPNYCMVYVDGKLYIESYNVEINFPPFCNKTYGDPSFLLLASHDHYDIQFESLDDEIISVAKNSGAWKGTIHNVGTARIRAYIDNGTGNPSYERIQTITVLPAPLNIRPVDKSKHYGEENPDLNDLIFYGLKYNDSKDDFGDNIQVVTTATKDSEVGEYPITASGAVNKNYYISYSQGNLKINKAIITISLEDDDVPVVYTGRFLYTSKNVSISGIIGNVNLPVSYTYKKENGSIASYAMNVGEYAVTAHTVGDNNHTEATTTTPAKFTVKKATPIVKLTSVSTEYNGEPVPVNKPVIDGSTTSNKLPYTAKYKGINDTNYPETSNPPVDYGTYLVTVTTPGDENHHPASNETTITIGKRTPVMSMTDKIETYNGSPFTLTATIDPSNLIVTYSYEGVLKDGTVYGPTAQAPIEAGDYMVTASTDGDHNHSATFVKARLEISRKEAKIDLTNKSTPYIGEPIAIEPPVTEPENAPLVITYKGVGETNYPENKQAPKNGGQYEVKAVFAGNNNYLPKQTTANLTITDAGSPTLTLGNKSVVYNGEAQSIGEATISPPFAEYLTVKYTYSNADYPASSTPPTNAGIYTVKATTEADTNFKEGSVTATLTIEKAEQIINFPEPGTKSISEVSFNAGASVNSGLPLTYTSGNTDMAEVSPDGTVTMKKAGLVTITTSQEGNDNYKEATLTRTLNITSNDANLYGLRINGIRITVDENMYYDLFCTEITNFDITLETEINASVNTGKAFSVTIDKPMLKVIKMTVTSQDGNVTKDYTLTIEKRFLFDEIVKTRWNNTMTVINNPDNNGGYRFTSFKWFRNGQEIATGQSYSAGSQREKLNATDKYYVELTSEDFEGVMRSCEGYPKLKSQTVTAYPNPLKLGETVYVDADVEEELLEGAVIDVYSISGLKIMQMKVQGRLTPIDLSNASTYIFKFRGKDGFSKDLKVIVK